MEMTTAYAHAVLMLHEFVSLADSSRCGVGQGPLATDGQAMHLGPTSWAGKKQNKTFLEIPTSQVCHIRLRAYGFLVTRSAKPTRRGNRGEASTDPGPALPRRAYQQMLASDNRLVDGFNPVLAPFLQCRSLYGSSIQKKGLVGRWPGGPLAQHPTGRSFP